MDQTDSLMVLILAKATVETKASLHRYPAVTLALDQSLTSDLVTPPAWPLLTSHHPHPPADPRCRRCHLFQMRIDFAAACKGGNAGLKFVNNVSREQFLWQVFCRRRDVFDICSLRRSRSVS